MNTVRNGGLKVYTTIQPRLQEAAQNAVDSCSVCYSGGGPASALASVDPSNGEIVALASTQRYSTEQPVQLRRPCPAPARLLVQGLRPDRGDQAGHRPRHDLLRRHLAEDAGDPGRLDAGRSTTPSRAAA